MKRVAGYLCNALCVLLTVLLLCNLYSIAARTFTGNPLPTVLGYAGAVVVSGSMAGTLEVNDLVVVHRQAAYAVGDVVTYENDTGSLVTHRVVARQGAVYTTQGDANNVADATVPAARICGRVVAVVPFVGALCLALQTPLGILALVVLGAVLFEWPLLKQKVHALAKGRKRLQKGDDADGQGDLGQQRGGQKDSPA